MELPDLMIMRNNRAVNELIKGYIIRQASVSGDINILEAGCGRRWPFDLEGIKYRLTAVDIDKTALEMRKHKRNDLDIAILGDLRSVELEESSYDIVYSSYVLEHIQGAEVVLHNIQKWLRPGGLMILRFPDRDSVYGFFTRITPYWLHVLFIKYIIGNPNAGKRGFGPFPTYHDKIISRKAFHEFVRENGLSIKEEVGILRLPPLLELFTKVIERISFGKLSSNHVNLLYILQKSK